MRDSSTIRQVWAAYKRPCPDIPGSVDIRVCLMPAGLALKAGLAGTILFLAVAAFAASPAGISRINRHHQNSGQFGFVFEKQAQLRERPAMQNGTLLAPGLDPCADSVEILNRKAAFGAFSFGNDLLGNIVIHPGGKTPLFAGKLLQTAFCCSGLFLLQPLPQSAVTVANRLHMRTGVLLAVRVSGYISDSEIDAQEVAGSNRRVSRQVYRAVQVEPSLAIDQISLPLNPVKPSFLVLAVDEWNYNPAFRERPQADAVHALKTEDSLIVCDRAVRLEYRANLLVAGEALNGFANRPHGHLGRQAVSLANLGVSQLVDTGLAEDSGLEATPCGVGCRFIDALHGCEQPFTLIWVRYKLQLERKLHSLGVYHSIAERTSGGERATLQSLRYSSAA